MIKEFVERWEKNKETIRNSLTKHPNSYVDLVKLVIQNITDSEYKYKLAPDPERIHSIDDGDYQGTLLFIIPDKGYQPSTYYSVFINYGSCSGCDTLQAIIGHEFSDSIPNEDQKNRYMTLCLHVVQKLKILEE